jgi:hypothetical protein
MRQGVSQNVATVTYENRAAIAIVVAEKGGSTAFT